MPYERTLSAELMATAIGKTLLDVVETVVIPSREPADADVVERGRPNLLESQLLGHRERFPAEADRFVVFAGERQEARQIGHHISLGVRTRLAVDESRCGSGMLERLISKALEPQGLGDQRLSFGAGFHVACGKQPVPCLRENVDASLLDQEQHTSVRQQKQRSVRIVGRPKLHGALVEALGRGVRAQCECSVTCLAQNQPCPLGEGGRVESGGACKLESARIVVREHLRVVIRATEPLDPLGSEPMLLRASSPRDLAVGDVAYEDMPERVLALFSDRRPTLTPHELLALEVMQAFLGSCRDRDRRWLQRLPARRPCR